MQPALSKKRLQHPYTWSEINNGQWVKASIQARIDEWSPKFFGYHMLKLGGLSCELTSHYCTIQHQVHLDIQNPLHNVVADGYNLPFVEKSFDAVFLAHQLDFCRDPHRLLREVDRVIIDDGYLVITGFNPVSLVGVASLLPWRKHVLPWSGRMFTPQRITDWLSVLNYQVIHREQYALLPTAKQQVLWTWLENSLGPIGPPLSSLYFIVARKRMYPLKPIKPDWRVKRNLSPLGVLNCDAVQKRWQKKP